MLIYAFCFHPLALLILCYVYFLLKNVELRQIITMTETRLNTHQAYQHQIATQDNCSINNQQQNQ